MPEVREPVARLAQLRGVGEIRMSWRYHSNLAAQLHHAYKAQAFRRQDKRCLYCDAALRYHEATLEHATPVSRGGTMTVENIDIACDPCNGAKGHLTRAEFIRAIHEPDYKNDPWPLYLACVQIRLKLRTERACRRISRMVA